MSVEKLSSFNFRNLANTTAIELHSEFNFFIGDNGSGKSSLLEALFFVGHGKSFRTSKVDNLVCYEKESCAVSVKDHNNIQLGLSRDSSLGLTQIKMNGEKQSKLSVIAKNIAVQIVTPESFKLFFGGPKERRRFIDLGMFHVKHDFSKQWRDFSRVLKQRNACIRNKADSKTLQYWTDQFVNLSEMVAQQRRNYVEAIIVELDYWLANLLPDLLKQVSVQYSAGWSDKKQLSDILNSTACKEREANYGYSMYGAHKFDVKFLLNHQPIESQLSRGQQKLFLLALTFAQTKIIERVNRVKPILLIDDIGAELDINSRQLLALSLSKVNCQFLITAIDEFVLQPLVANNKKHKMFHVKHGEVLEINTKSE